MLSALVGLPASFAGEVVSGGSFTLVGGPISGGGSVGGGGLVLHATAGETAPGVFQGGDLDLIGTLHGAVEAVIDGDKVSIRAFGDGRVRVDWPTAAAG